MSYRHLFIIDPLETLNIHLDSSLRMMFELHSMGHHIWICEPKDLIWSSETGPQVMASTLQFGSSPAAFTANPKGLLSQSSMHAIHMRKDPPYDIDYIATTWLLDPATKTSKVYNHPEALRRYNEKLAILRFPEDIKPALVSSEPQVLRDFIIRKCFGDAILKPLTLFGGRGVRRLNISSTCEDGLTEVQLLAALEEETHHGKQVRLVQPFDDGIFEGEVRVFTAFGEAVAWCLKKPAKGQFLANTRAGAELFSYQPTDVEKERVSRVARKLFEDGVAFVGFDLIGGYISEINLTSPRLLQASHDLSNPYHKIAQLIEKDIIQSRSP